MPKIAATLDAAVQSSINKTKTISIIVIGIINYGLGNVKSVLNMYHKMSIKACLVSCPSELLNVHQIILPGVGSFDTGMNYLRDRGFLEYLTDAVINNKVPILGICLGMQLLGHQSEEGKQKGLGWINANVVKINVNSSGNNKLKVPNMGWLPVSYRKTATLFKNIAEAPRFYFVHSYHLLCENSSDVCGIVEYGGPICVSVERGNIFGTQFHPEKSHRFGMAVLRNFASVQRQQFQQISG